MSWTPTDRGTSMERGLMSSICNLVFGEADKYDDPVTKELDEALQKCWQHDHNETARKVSYWSGVELLNTGDNHWRKRFVPQNIAYQDWIVPLINLTVQSVARLSLAWCQLLHWYRRSAYLQTLLDAEHEAVSNYWHPRIMSILEACQQYTWRIHTIPVGPANPLCPFCRYRVRVITQSDRTLRIRYVAERCSFCASHAEMLDEIIANEEGVRLAMSFRNAMTHEHIIPEGEPDAASGHHILEDRP